MKRLAELFIAGLDIVGIQFATMREGILRLFGGMVLVGAGGVLVVTGCALALYGLHQALASAAGPAFASCFTGFFALLLAGALGWLGWRAIK